MIINLISRHIILVFNYIFVRTFIQHTPLYPIIRVIFNFFEKKKKIKNCFSLFYRLVKG